MRKIIYPAIVIGIAIFCAPRLYHNYSPSLLPNVENQSLRDAVNSAPADNSQVLAQKYERECICRGPNCPDGKTTFVQEPVLSKCNGMFADLRKEMEKACQDGASSAQCKNMSNKLGEFLPNALTLKATEFHNTCHCPGQGCPPSGFTNTPKELYEQDPTLAQCKKLNDQVLDIRLQMEKQKHASGLNDKMKQAMQGIMQDMLKKFKKLP